MELEEKPAVSLLTGRAPQEPEKTEFVTRAMHNNGSGLVVKRLYDTKIAKTGEIQSDVELELLFSKVPAGASLREMLDIVSSVQGVTSIEFIFPSGDSIVVSYSGEAQ